ncbi:MAG: 50S ribosomal protein L13 [Christensenellaceae bacterium]|nr:50S ribosomal protein L13 [Christensenellaceae bacterium]
MQKSFHAKESNIEREWWEIDAAGLPVGRLCSRVALILRGKHKPTFTPSFDAGDFVIITNADKAIFTGKKMTDKYFFSHSGYVGGDKFIQAKEAMKKDASWVIERGVKGMLPKNSIGRTMFKKLKVYNGAEHPHAAQMPKKLVIKGRAN